MEKKASKSIKNSFIILSRNPSLYATKRLNEELQRKQKNVLILDPVEVTCQAKKGDVAIYYKNSRLEKPIFVIPRMTQHSYDYTIMVLKSMQIAGFRILNPIDSIIKSKDKFMCLMELASRGIEVVPSILIRSTNSIKHLASRIGNTPLVVKAVRSMAGMGTTLIENNISLNSSLQMMWYSWYDTMVQKYIENTPPFDYRVIVLESKIIGTVIRRGKGDFRTNFHQGGIVQSAELPIAVQRMVLKSVRIIGMNLAAVDLIEKDGKYYVLEINSSPGFEGIERALNKNIAKIITDHCIKQLKSY